MEWPGLLRKMAQMRKVSLRHFRAIKPFPLNTFLVRFYRKIRSLIHNEIKDFLTHIYYVIRAASGIKAARSIAKLESGSEHLELIRSSPLGKKGDVIQIPKDKVIHDYVIKRGKWEFDESEFLAAVLNNQSVAAFLLDIGANSGLITRQTLYLLTEPRRVFMVEPIPLHLESIKFNIQDHTANHSITICPFGLGKVDGTFPIYTEIDNHGNSSFMLEAIPTQGSKRTDVPVKNTEKFTKEFLPSVGALVIKSDLQGLDAIVLSAIPEEIWQRTAGAVVEVWAHEKIDEGDIATLRRAWRCFDEISWSDDRSRFISLNEALDFWLSKDLGQRNLYLKNNSLPHDVKSVKKI